MVVALRRIGPEASTWSSAVERFLEERDLARGTTRVYRLTLARVGQALGDPGLADITAPAMASALADAYPDAAAASWNRQVATLRSFYGYLMRQGLASRDITDRLERRRETVDHDRALTREHVEQIVSSPALTVRDRALFRMLYETAARANEVLRLNVEDLDQHRKRATTVRKGGDLDVIHWATGTARLLPHVVSRRTRGPLFLAANPPSLTRAPAGTDIDPTSGLARLSYRRAAEIFKSASGGATLHQLRHSAITHLAEEGVPITLLMAKSRHESLKTLQRYARPGVEAVAELTAAHDPARRR
jgi:site-specific recombinase XerD